MSIKIVILGNGISAQLFMSYLKYHVNVDYSCLVLEKNAKENIDNIKGIVYIKDILLSKKDKKTRIRNLMKEAYFVPETKKVD